MQEISSRSTNITVSDQARKGDGVLYWTDNRKASKKLGWQPTESANRLCPHFRLDSGKRRRTALPRFVSLDRDEKRASA
jgi:UDP-glucose 4-epimerase